MFFFQPFFAYWYGFIPVRRLKNYQITKIIHPQYCISFLEKRLKLRSMCIFSLPCNDFVSNYRATVGDFDDRMRLSFCRCGLVKTRKYPLRGYFLGVLAHTTAWDQHGGGIKHWSIKSKFGSIKVTEPDVQQQSDWASGTMNMWF